MTLRCVFVPFQEHLRGSKMLLLTGARVSALAYTCGSSTQWGLRQGMADLELSSAT